MRTISWSEFQQLYLQDELRYSHLYGDKEHPRVILDNEKRIIIKLFFPKKLFSSDKIWPYAQRFKYNSKKLSARGITAPVVDEVFAVNGHPKGRLLVVAYPFLSGKTIRELTENPQSKKEVLDRFARYLVHLHESGILFRAIHLANILFQSPETFALIDIGSMRFKTGPLSIKKRARNLKYLLKNHDEKKAFDEATQTHFMQIYLQHAKLKPNQQQYLVEEIFN